MRIGIFDSGLGGLIVARAVQKAMPEYDYIYLGDTKRLPYGNKTQNEIYKNTIQALRYLFEKDCVLVVIACNTASSQALRRVQQEWLPKSKYFDRKVLGVIRPTVEMVEKARNIGLIGTLRTVDSTAYLQELQKINKNIKLLAKATPKLVSMVESGKYEDEILKNYLVPFKNVEILILGCTHFGMLKKEIQNILGKKIKIIAQEDILPGKLKSYLAKHKEITKKLGKSKKFEILVTKSSRRYEKLSREWFGAKTKPKLINL
ncbi:glutamate racemase [Candidatus Nomurabacteria bacterium]|nr:glutamate racemase [Candidatus Nomurabacteria bacterium]